MLSLFQWIIAVIILHRNAGEASENELVMKSSCICPGYLLTLECTVVGSAIGTTVWKGNFFNCSNGIILLHNRERFTTVKQDCNDGSIVAQGLAIDANCYTSQINVTMNSDLNGGSIECYYDFDGQMLVDSLTINTTGPLPPPSTIFVSKAKLEARKLNFTWSPVASDCPAIHYNILSSNCGRCPTTTNHTTVTCTDVPTNGSVCTFAVQTVVCGNITGKRSDLIRVLSMNSIQNIFIDRKESFPILIVGIVLVTGVTALAGVYMCWKIVKKFSRSSTPREICNATNQANDENYYTIKVFDNQKTGMYGLVDDHHSEEESGTDTKDKPDLNSILRVLYESQVTPNWYLFGLAIEVPKGILDQLKLQKYSDEDCLVEILDHWLRNHYSQPTWQEVLEAKKKVEFFRMAKNCPT